MGHEVVADYLGVGAVVCDVEDCPACRRLRAPRQDGRVSLTIAVDDLSGAGVAALLEEHLAEMRATSPPESVHALDLEALRDPAVTFWTVHAGRDLVGCGALKDLGDGTVELKSMRTALGRQGGGVATSLLGHLLDEARSRGARAVLLETGTQDHFAPARRLYARHGFEDCPPFGDYELDPHSVFMRLDLTPSRVRRSGHA